MKKHLSKRLLSLLLAAVMLVASAPVVAYGYSSTELAEAISASSDVKYLFAYFTSNTQYGQQIRFAVSEDGLNYEPLNYNSPVITHSDEYFEEVDEVEANTQYASSTYSSSAGYSRDPYVFWGGDAYYLICTDMDASTGGQHEGWTGDTCFVIFRSEDLMNWYQISVFSAEDLGEIACTDGSTRSFSDTIRAWAPEVIYDESTGQYLLYWSNFFSDWYESVFGVYLTDDFTGFAEGATIYEMYHTSSGAAIDADIVEYDGTYYMFYKDEANAEIGCVTSETLTGPYSQDTYTDVTEGVSSVAVEGCQVYQIGDSDYYVLMMDEYNNGTFVFGITDDLANLNFEGMDTADYSLSGFSPRHGSVIQISNEEYEALVSSGGTNVSIGTIEYPFSNENTWSDPTESNWYFGSIEDGSGYYFDVAIGAWTSSGFEDYVISDTGYGPTSGAYAQTGDGYTAYMSNIFINDTSVREYLSSDSFTVSFDYTPYMDDLYNNSGTLLASWTDGNSNGDQSGSAVIFAISTLNYGGTDNNAVDFIRVLQNGTLEVYTESGVYQSYSYDAPSTGVSANYTITYDGSKTVLYIDNEEVATIEATIPGINEGTSGNGNSFYASLGWTDACADHYKPFGKYENLVFYDRAFTATEAQLGMATDLSTVESCMDTLEDLFGSGDLYYGMSDALAAYIEAQELITVRDYGTVDVTDELSACLDTLQTTIENMSLYHDSYQTESLYTAYFSVEEVGSSILAASGNTYDASDQDSGAWQINDDGDLEVQYYTDYTRFILASYTRTTLSVYGDSYILLYDGTNDVSVPLKFSYQNYSYNILNNDTYDNGLLSVFLNNSNLTVNSTTSDSILLTGITDRDYARYHWNEQLSSDLVEGNYYTIANYPVSNSEYYSSFYASTGLGFREHPDNDYHFFGNISVVYDDEPTETLTTVNPNVIFVDAYGNSTSFGNGGANNAAGTGSPSTKYQTGASTSTSGALDGTSAFADGYASTYYILDVSDITEALDEVSASLASHNLSDYSAVMVDVFDVLEDVMAYSPYDTVKNYLNADGYIDSSDMEAVAEELETEIDNYVEMVEQLADVVVYNDYDGYDALKIARDDASIRAAYATADPSVYTEESWEAFVAAYEEAVDEIDRLADTDTHFRNQLAENNIDYDLTIYNVVEDLYAAYYGLRTHADFTDVQEAEVDDDVQDGVDTGLGDDMEDQNYTYGSWYNFETAYNAVVDFNDENPDDTVYAMYADADETTISVGSYGLTFTVTPESDTYSEIQQESYDLAAALREAVDLLAPVAADYSVYNAVTEEIKNQDVGAFAKGEDAALYTLLREQGTQEASVTYSVNGSVTVDTPVFNADTNVVTDEDGNKSINETAYVVDADGNVWKNMSDQVTLDDYIYQMITNLNLVNEDTSDENEERAKYTVTYIVKDGDEEETIFSDTYYYGETYTATLPEGYEYAYKWVVTANGTTVELPASGSYTAYITSDVTIVAYVSETVDENLITVQILNLYGNIVQEYYVDEDTVITVDKNYLAIDDTELTSDTFSWLADTPFYTFDGWQVNGANYNNGTTFTLGDVVGEDGVVTLKIKMNVTSGEYTISLDGSTIGNYVYDEKVTVTPADNENAYGIAIKIGDSYYAVSYDTDAYSFYTVGNAELFTIYKDSSNTYIINDTTVTDTEVIWMLNNKLPFSYSIGQLTDEGNVFTTYSAYTANLPEGVEITEVGTIYTTDSTLATEDDLVLDNEEVSYIAAKNPNATTMQYYLRLSGCSDKTVYTRSYVKYSYTAADGETIIQTVYYGNIVSNVTATD